ncbi:MAG: hydroxymethylglutaryl-CoA reductase, degradative [Thaumarchaeota archaeon]|nr:hydroxymethylglutaryl-CoA reductase, degradative [Nitrososphaerota archaeon]
MKSSISKFYQMGLKQRLQLVKKFANLNNNDLRVLKSCGGLSFKSANVMSENVIGTMAIPLGIATNFLINERDYLIPMVIEEPSVIAAASNAAKIARVKGGFTAIADQSLMIGQIQVVDLQKLLVSGEKVLETKNKIIEIANTKSRTLVNKGAGVKDVIFRVIDTIQGKILIVELIIDVRDAMGANIVNTMCEAVAPYIENVTGGRALLKILSNYTTKRLTRASVVFSKEEIGSEIVNDILLAYAFAMSDQYRCTTHNKGVMNGIIAVANATGQDSRAIEAGAHSYAARNGKYSSLTSWSKDNNGDLIGSIEIPLAVGIVGGISSVHPLVKTCLKILHVKKAQDLACVMASVGLAQNFAALYALVSEGIQKGHMSLHARNIATISGAKGKLIGIVAEIIADEGNVTTHRAKEVLKNIKK